MIEISKLVDSIKSNQDSAVINEIWRPDSSSLSYNDLETWVSALIKGKANQPMADNQQRSNDPRQLMSFKPSHDEQGKDMS